MVRKDVRLFCLFVLLNLRELKEKCVLWGFFLNINNGKGL